MLCETSEQKYTVDDGCLKSCSTVSGPGLSEQQKECLIPERTAIEPACEYGHGDGVVVPGQLMDNCSIESSELKHSARGISKIPDNINEGCTEVPNNSKREQLGLLPDDKSKSAGKHYQVVLALKYVAEGCAGKQSGAKHITSYQKSGRRYRKTQAEGTNYSGRTRGGKKGQKNRIHDKTPATKGESEYPLRSSTDRRKGRRSSTEDNPAASEPDSNMEKSSSVRKRGRKKGQRNSNVHNEYSRMRVHLRYLLHRIRYEQNLIDAYSSEGWRGQSLEKLRPEKELERAKLNINRIKLKIRDLFQHLDAVCAEGRFPESLFDSEGLVDSEDIFCAKCARKDLSPNNDIILCDGTCDRGFHQLCLDPPLRTEEIPPGDEGWFCPACDCRFDCVELLNDSMGTKLSINHSFEKVFPEATAKPGSAQDDTAGLPSDDSEDNDYNPEGADDDNMEGGESTSDESDFSSASEDLGAIHNTDDQYLGLPSDDPEDDDFDPNFEDAEDQPKQGSSSSDFSSASEDLNATIEDNKISSKDEHQDLGAIHNTDDQYLGLPSDDPEDDDFDPNFEDSEDQPKQGSSNSDFSSASVDFNATIEDNEISSKDEHRDCDDPVPVTGRRQSEKLDYKKLYDETYGNATTDSSDDEEWGDAVTPKKRKNGGKNTSDSSEGEECRVTPKRRYGPKRNASSLAPSNDIPAAAGGLNTCTKGKSSWTPKAKVSNDSRNPETSSGLKSNARKPYVRLGEEAIKRLYASFEENQYPDNCTKEKLAGELGLTPTKVRRWFETARWNINQSAAVAGASTSRGASRGRRKARPSSAGAP